MLIKRHRVYLIIQNIQDTLYTKYIIQYTLYKIQILIPAIL